MSFYAAGCELCGEQMRAMRRLREELAGRLFEVVAGSCGESAAKVHLSVDLDPSQEGAGP